MWCYYKCSIKFLILCNQKFTPTKYTNMMHNTLVTQYVNTTTREILLRLEPGKSKVIILQVKWTATPYIETILTAYSVTIHIYQAQI